MYIYYNPNHRSAAHAEDCVVRAIAKVTGETWEEIYLDLVILGFKVGDMPSSNRVWGKYLMDRGFQKYLLPDTCPDCYTVYDFCIDNPKGTFVLATGSHAIAVVDGDYYDIGDSGGEVPVYLFKRR